MHNGSINDYIPGNFDWISPADNSGGRPSAPQSTRPEMPLLSQPPHANGIYTIDNDNAHASSALAQIDAALFGDSNMQTVSNIAAAAPSTTGENNADNILQRVTSSFSDENNRVFEHAFGKKLIPAIAAKHHQYHLQNPEQAIKNATQEAHKLFNHISKEYMHLFKQYLATQKTD